MAKYLNLDGLLTLWNRLIKYHPYKWDSYVNSDRYYTNIFSIECSQFKLNKPFIFNLYGRGYSSSKVEIFIQNSTVSKSPGILTFKHIINRFEGSSGVTSNVGYTYHDDETGVRTYRFWKRDNEKSGWTASNVECYADYMEIVSFGGGVSLSEPEGIVWADILYDNVSTSDVSKWNAKQDALTTQTAYSAKGSATKVPKITTNALGQVTNIEEVTITQPDVSGKLDINASNASSGTSKGIFDNASGRPDGDTYDVTSDDVLLVQDNTGDVVRRTTVSRFLANVNANLRALSTDKIDKSDIVQNLNAENESKVPSQKAVRNAVSVLDEGKINKSDIVQNLNAENESKVPSQKAVRNAVSVLSDKIDKVTKSTESSYGYWFIGVPITLCYTANAVSTQAVEYDVGTLVRNLYKEVKVNSDDCGRLFVLMNETNHTLNLTGFVARTSTSGDTQTFQLLSRRLTAFVHTNGWYRMDV